MTDELEALMESGDSEGGNGVLIRFQISVNRRDDETSVRSRITYTVDDLLCQHQTAGSADGELSQVIEKEPDVRTCFISLTDYPGTRDERKTDP